MLRTRNALLLSGPLAALIAGTVLFSGTTASMATPGHGDVERGDLARGLHHAGGEIPFQTGEETVAYTATMAPGATSGWHRHPGALVVLVKSGTLTSYGLDGDPCIGENIVAGDAYFEGDAAGARYPHFVRNRGSEPLELVVVAFNVPQAGSPRTDADAPDECTDPTS